MKPVLAQPILVVDDDPKIVSLVRMYLEREGYPVLAAADGAEALRVFEMARPRLVVLDVMLPELDGISVMQRVRETSDIPIVMLSARGATADRVFGISEGADDYIAKPFSPAELVVRVKAVLRRSAGSIDSGILELHDLEVDLDRYEVRRDGRVVPLTPAEFRLLAALVRAGGRVLTRQALLDALYGRAEGDAMERTVDVHIRRLREKLDEPAANPHYVVTVRGAGYRANPSMTV
jgi:DNA-binding response OmpR family regulator